MSEKEKEGGRMTGEEMDERRSESVAYQYLCRLEESKKWVEACIGEEIAVTVELEEHLTNGVTLAKLAHFISPEKVSLKKIYDMDLSRYKTKGLHFRHTDNINHFLTALLHIKLPEIFYPETTDVYDRKNIPRLIYCIHALSLYMYRIGRAPQIIDLYGKIQFTEEEISNMKRELDKYGITMPSFSKIGGILANEMPVDEAELHAAVIAINTAIDHQQPQHTYKALCNPSAHLQSISEEHTEDYQRELEMSRRAKTKAAFHKHTDDETGPDAYDELLTQAEIQAAVSSVNDCHTVTHINLCLKRRNGEEMVEGLKKGGFVGVDVSRIGAYMKSMAAMAEQKEGSELTREEVQQAISAVNQLYHKQLLEKEGVNRINQSLEGTEACVTFNDLQNPHLALPELQSHAMNFYHSELQGMRQEKEVDLNLDELVQALNILNAIVHINDQIDLADPDLFHASLRHQHILLEHLQDENDDAYLQELRKTKSTKFQEGDSYLTYQDMQEVIATVNSQAAMKLQKVKTEELINEALLNGNPQATYEVLKQQFVENVHEATGVHYHDVLKTALQLKQQERGEIEEVLRLDEVHESVQHANNDLREAENLSARVAAINLAVENEDEDELRNFLKEFFLQSRTRLVPAYLVCLHAYKTDKIVAKPSSRGSGWMQNKTASGSKYYFNVHSLQGSWLKQHSGAKDYSILTKKDIENCIKTVNESSHLNWLFISRETCVIQLQAYAKGCLVRKSLMQKRRLWSNSVPFVVVIQRWWRRGLNGLKRQKCLQYYQQRCSSVLSAQSLVRMYLARRKYLHRQNFFRQNEDSVVKIQSFVRSAAASKDYHTLMTGSTPSVSMIRKFLHLLDVTEKDYSQQIELDELKQRLVQEIRRNQHLDKVLCEMDTRIGLLVKNRISLQDVISQNKSLHQTSNSSNRNSTMPESSSQGGLKALSKASHDKLQAYQHLFYLLQTQPHYLARLIFLLPQSRTTKFMQGAILSIFNYAANQRDHCMLLGLFKTALQEEIRCKITSPSDISTGNPMVVKLIVTFNRTPRGQNVLRDLLGGLVGSVLQDTSMLINTNVVDVYKQWLNSIEAASGKPSGMPYEVSVEEALTHQQVALTISSTIDTLQQAANLFQTSILNNIHMIPYGMRYMAKVMKSTLQIRFPDTPEKEILKVVGNFIYYRYINSAIVAPDAFDIIDVTASNGLSNEQRRNLGSIAKILQFSAANKGFGTDSPHLVGMNKYIMQAHASFKAYFYEICNVDEPEVVFNIDQYSDISLITKPLICISVGEMVEMHRLLLEHADTIAPSTQDPLHELLHDLGNVVGVEALLGEQESEEKRDHLAKTEITLTLSSKHQGVAEGEEGLDSMWVKTKQMVVDILRSQRSGDTLVKVLETLVSEEEERGHQAFVFQRRCDELNVSKVSRQCSSEEKLPLEQMKVVVKENLARLEQEGFVSRQDAYQAILNSILKDLRNLRLQRQLRRKELERLLSTLSSLLTKRTFFEEQINYYNQYVQICLDKQAARAKKKTTLKYTAFRLHEKGVLLGIEGVKLSQFKTVHFDIASTEVSGLFLIKAKFMGVNMDKLQLNFQDLLELQYAGQAIIKLYDRAQVNVNLLIHLLNNKFYGLK